MTQTPAATPRKAAHQYSRMKSEIAITSRVKAGRSAPKLENSSLNWGMTNIMMTTVTMMATTMTAAG